LRAAGAARCSFVPARVRRTGSWRRRLLELIAAAALFVLWECLVRAPDGALLLAAPIARVRAVEGVGWRMRSPLPSAPGLLALRLPFTLEAGGVRGAAGAFADFAALATAQAVGRRVLVSGRSFARLSSPVAAVRVAELLRALPACAPEARASRLDAFVRESLTLSRARAALESAERATRWLAPLCDVYASLALVAVPLLLWLDYEDRVLRAVLPLLGSVHAACIALVFRAHRRIAPAARSARFDLVLSAGLFPPAMLTAPKALLAEAFAGLHPLATAAVLLAPADFASFARRERARLDARARAGDAAAALERAGLDAIGRELDFDLAAPPPRADPQAASYCPRCFSDFRPGFGACSDCGVATVAYPTA
jgi:hypothetical protein